MKQVLQAVKNISDNVDHISEYRVIGGEPLMNKKWAEITNKIIDQDPKRNIYIYTNATICPKNEDLESFKGKNVIDYWRQFDNVSVGVSIDCVGDRAEYVRYGTNWKTVHDNFVLLNKLVTLEMANIPLRSILHIER
jgi:MoaA/NifB/PqqE/SkfB family radical SAM enzyme